MGLFILNKRRSGGISICVNVWKENINKTKPGSSNWYPLKWQEAMDGWKLEGVKFHLNTRKCLSTVKIVTGTGCKRLWIVYLRRYWKSVWIWSWTACSFWPFKHAPFKQGHCTRWPQGVRFNLNNFLFLWLLSFVKEINV